MTSPLARISTGVHEVGETVHGGLVAARSPLLRLGSRPDSDVLVEERSYDVFTPNEVGQGRSLDRVRCISNGTPRWVGETEWIPSDER